MPHERTRHLERALSKSLRYWPVVCVTGARQVGKTTLLRKLRRFHYVSMDDPAILDLALRNPKSVLTPPSVIDEAQKCPKIFDAVKLDVDERKIPGKYVLTGSVRFSKRTLIRESLTGRSLTLQLFPMTCSETLSLDFQYRWWNPGTSRMTRREFQRFLSQGGMPAIFSARGAHEKANYWSALTESYLYRDLLMAVDKNPNPSLARSLLKAICETLALGELPRFSRILRKVGGPRQRAEKHLLALEDMMVIHRIHRLGGTQQQDIFLPFDPAFFLSILALDSAAHDAAIHIACMHIALMNEFLAQTMYAGDTRAGLYYAESPSGQLIHLVTHSRAKGLFFWKLFEEPVPHSYDLRYLSALAEKHKGRAIALTSTERPFSTDSESGIKALPWESVL